MPFEPNQDLPPVTHEQVLKVKYGGAFQLLDFKPSVMGWNNQYAVVMCHLSENEVTPYATWVFNGNDNTFCNGDYCRTLEQAKKSYNERS